MNTVKRHTWPRWIAGTALVAGLSLAAGAGVFPQALVASPSEASQRSDEVSQRGEAPPRAEDSSRAEDPPRREAAPRGTAAPLDEAVPLDVKDATVSKLGDRKETSLAASSLQRAAGRGDTGPRDPETLPGKRPATNPAQELKKLSVALGGCVREYGTAGQCLPVVPPSAAAHVQDMVDAGMNPKSMSHPWTCSELRTYFPDGIAVRKPGVDPQRLDLDRDGIGCSVND